MFELYPQIKQAHMFLAFTSGAFFAVRGLGAVLNADWQRTLIIKLLSYAIDISLLTAAFMLLTILPWSMFNNGWLLAKLGFLIVYIVLGIFALRSKSLRGRVVYYLLALSTFLYIVSIARTHHPLGILSKMTSWG